MKQVEAFLVLVISWLSVSGQECSYKFTEEPRIAASCNPYNQDKFRLHCTVKAPHFDFTIKWKWQANLASEITELESTLSDFIDGGIRSQLFVKNLSIHAGTYWCLVELFNGTNLEDSNKFTLLNFYENDLMNCSSTESFSAQSINRCIHAVSSIVETLPPIVNDEIGISTTFPPDQTTTSPPGDLGPALYAVIAVILVFCFVIITLSITIVVLYRRGCARQGHFKTSDERANNPYSGFTSERERSIRASSDVTRDRAVSVTSSTNCTRPHHLATHSPAPLLTASTSPQDDYSHLIRSHSSTQSPRETGLASGYSKLNVLEEAVPQSGPTPRESCIYNELDDNDLEQYVSSDVPTTRNVPPVNIYNSLDGPRSAPSTTHEGQDLVVSKHSSRAATTRSPALFDDPGYSPIGRATSKDGKQFEIVDPRYRGDYQRSPEYTCPTIKVNLSEIDPKYRGNYERDPNYVPNSLPHQGASVSTNQKEATNAEQFPRRRSEGAIDPLLKYRGDYERSPTYVPSPLRENEELSRKYAGNYERDPVYMANVIQKAQKSRANSVERPYVNSLPKENGVVSHSGYVNIKQEQNEAGSSNEISSDSNPKNNASTPHSYVNVVTDSEDTTDQVLSKRNPYSDSFLKERRPSRKKSVKEFVDLQRGSIIPSVSNTVPSREKLEQGTFIDI